MEARDMLRRQKTGSETYDDVIRRLVAAHEDAES